MGIPVPQLDDERYKRLVEELRAAIIRYAPEWTDLNNADPRHHDRRGVRLPW